MLISPNLVSESHLNNIYNLSHCTINVANEGFGLSTLESVFTDTPIIINKMVDYLTKLITNGQKW